MPKFATKVTTYYIPLIVKIKGDIKHLKDRLHFFFNVFYGFNGKSSRAAISIYVTINENIGLFFAISRYR